MLYATHFKEQGRIWKECGVVYVCVCEWMSDQFSAVHCINKRNRPRNLRSIDEDSNDDDHNSSSSNSSDSVCFCGRSNTIFLKRWIAASTILQNFALLQSVAMVCVYVRIFFLSLYRFSPTLSFIRYVSLIRPFHYRLIRLFHKYMFVFNFSFLFIYVFYTINFSFHGSSRISLLGSISRPMNTFHLYQRMITCAATATIFFFFFL